MPTTIKVLKALGSSYFRVDWIGHVVPRCAESPATPSVKIVGVVKQSLGELLSRDGRGQIELTVPVAYLRMIRLGDIWQHGERVQQSNGEQYCFKNLRVDETTVDVKPAGFPIMEGVESRYLLPFQHYASHRLHTGSQIARVRIDESTYLVIPCMELIRFYFGESGKLLSRMFDGRIGNGEFYESVQLNSREVAHLKLADGIPGPAAQTVARIALSRHAASAARWIGNSGTRAAANSEYYYPATRFPFDGSTNLTAAGHWIRQSSYSVFIVDRLITCTHPFPFQSLFYELHPNEKRRQHEATSSGAGARRRTSGKDEIELGAGPVKSTWTRATVAAGEEPEAFPDLRNKSVRRTKVSIEDSCFRQAASDSPLAVGPKATNGSNREVDISSTARHCQNTLPPAQAVMKAAIKILRDEYGFEFEIRPLPRWQADDYSTFRKIHYVHPRDQALHPAVVAVRLQVLNSTSQQEYLLLVPTAPLALPYSQGAIFLVNDKYAGLAGDGLWTTIALRAAARRVAGLRRQTGVDTYLEAIYLSHREVVDSSLLAEAFWDFHSSCAEVI